MTERRAATTAEIVERLVRAFYGKVRKDALIGAMFDERIADWEPHLQCPRLPPRRTCPRVFGVGYGQSTIATIYPRPHDIPLNVV